MFRGGIIDRGIFLGIRDRFCGDMAFRKGMRLDKAAQIGLETGSHSAIDVYQPSRHHPLCILPENTG